MTKATGCTICRHPALEAINAEAVSPGIPIAHVARKYSLGRESVRRHVRGCIAELVAQATKASELSRAEVEIAAGRNLIDRLAEAEKLIRDAAKIGVEAKDGHLMVRAGKELARVAELFAQVRGELVAGAVHLSVKLDDEVLERVAVRFLKSRGLLPAAAIETTVTADPGPPEAVRTE